MQTPISRKVWNDLDEIQIQNCIEEAFLNKGYDVKNLHKSERRNEDGIDIICKNGAEKIGIAVKIKPRKGDIDQLKKFQTHKDIRKIYIYVDHPTTHFEKEIEKYNENEIEFWNWDRLHIELISSPSTQYLIKYLLQNPLLNNISNMHYSLYNCRNIKFHTHRTSHDELRDLWNIKDDAVKLRAILDHIHRRWGKILMEKTEFDNSEYKSTLDNIFHELEIVNEICGIKLKDSFIKFEKHYPYLLGLFWKSVGDRTHWRTFMHTLDSPLSETEVRDFIQYKWLMPDCNSSVMKSFYSSLLYILLHLFNVSKNVEDGIDSVFSIITETEVLNREQATNW